MRYMLCVIDRQPGTIDPSDVHVAIDAFNDQLEVNGYWIMAAGIEPSQMSTVVDNRAGKSQSTNGPLIESDEYISGFWIVDVPSHDVALQLAHEGSMACNRKVDVRAFLR